MSDLLARLIAAGTPADLVAEVALAVARAEVAREVAVEDEERKERKRANNAERQRRFKARQGGAVTEGNAGNALVTEGNVTAAPLSPFPNENISNPIPHTPPENIPAREEPIFHVEAWKIHLAAIAAAKPKRAKGVRTVGQDHPMPNGWEPVLTDRSQQIVDRWPPGMWDRELSKFRNHAADKGRVSKDWQAAFRTWTDNAEERRISNGNANYRASNGAHRPPSDEIQNPYARAVVARQAARSCDGPGQPDCWP